MAERKYYWLKLHKDFFKRHDIRIIESMPNGKDYVLFYLKLLVESIDHDGQLRFSDTIPYNEQMLSTVTDTNIDIVRSAMNVFGDLKMIDVLEDSTIFMAEVERLLGCETSVAERVRKHRVNQIMLHCNADVTHMKRNCNTEIEIEKDIDTEIEKDSISSVQSDKPIELFEQEEPCASEQKYSELFVQFWSAYPKKQSKATALKAWNKIKPNKELAEKIISAVEQAKKNDKRFRDAQYIPMPSTWLNARGWEDEFDGQAKRATQEYGIML